MNCYYINVETIGKRTPVHAEGAAMLVQGVEGGDVGGALHHLVHPLDGAHHFVPFGKKKILW